MPRRLEHFSSLHCSCARHLIISDDFYCRMSAVAYLASYLSRAKFVSASLVADMLERLLNILYLLMEDFFDVLLYMHVCISLLHSAGCGNL